MEELNNPAIQGTREKLEKLRKYNEVYMNLKNLENKMKVNKVQDYLSESNPTLIKFKREEYEKMLFQIKAVQE